MAQTRARAPPGSGRAGSTRSSAAGTPAGTAGDSSASWTLLSAPTMGCPRNRVNSISTVRRESGILMPVNPGLLSRASDDLAAITYPRSAWVNNLVLRHRLVEKQGFREDTFNLCCQPLYSATLN